MNPNEILDSTIKVIFMGSVGQSVSSLLVEVVADTFIFHLSHFNFVALRGS